MLEVGDGIARIYGLSSAMSGAVSYTHLYLDKNYMKEDRNFKEQVLEIDMYLKK